MYEKPEGLWGYGTWVNGGHWSTCEARMMLAYYRLGKFEDARKSMRQLLTFAERFRMDNPLTKCGSDVYQPNEPINLCYDSFGPAAALMRGLFEYLYRADGLTLVPHVPPGITELEQLDPVRFGEKRILLSTVGAGPITAVRVNGRKWKQFDRATVFLPYSKTPELARVQIVLGDAQAGRASVRASPNILSTCPKIRAREDARPPRLRGNLRQPISRRWRSAPPSCGTLSGGWRRRAWGRATKRPMRGWRWNAWRRQPGGGI